MVYSCPLTVSQLIEEVKVLETDSSFSLRSGAVLLSLFSTEVGRLKRLASEDFFEQPRESSIMFYFFELAFEEVFFSP